MAGAPCEVVAFPVVSEPFGLATPAARNVLGVLGGALVGAMLVEDGDTELERAGKIAGCAEIGRYLAERLLTPRNA